MADSDTWHWPGFLVAPSFEPVRADHKPVLRDVTPEPGPPESAPLSDYERQQNKWCSRACCNVCASAAAWTTDELPRRMETEVSSAAVDGSPGVKPLGG
jgi:hypothetical protein